MSPGVFWVFCVGTSVVLHVHILEFKVVLCLFHGSSLVLSQCTIFLPSLWLPCIYLLFLISGIRHDFYQTFHPKSIYYHGKVDLSAVVCP